MYGNFTIIDSDVENDNYTKVFENSEIRILLFKYKTTEEASSAKWNTLECEISDVMNSEIFSPTTLEKDFLNSLEELMGKNEVVMFCDIERTCSSKFHNNSYSAKEIHSALDKATNNLLTTL